MAVFQVIRLNNGRDRLAWANSAPLDFYGSGEPETRGNTKENWLEVLKIEVGLKIEVSISISI